MAEQIVENQMQIHHSKAINTVWLTGDFWTQNLELNMDYKKYENEHFTCYAIVSFR